MPVVAACAIVVFGNTDALGAMSTGPINASVAANGGLGAGELDELSGGGEGAGDMGIPSITPQEAGYVVQHWKIEHGLPLDRLTSLAQTPDGFLWIGTDDQGLSRFDGRNFVNLNPLNEPGLPGWRVPRLLTDSLGRLWVQNGRDLSIRENGRFRLMLEGSGGPLAEDSNGNIVIHKLDRFELRRFRDGEFEVISTSDAPVSASQPRVTSAIQCDRWDRVWGIDASQNQLYEQTSHGPIVHELPQAVGSSESVVKTFVRLRDGELGLLTPAGLYVRTRETWTLQSAYPPSMGGRIQPRIATCDSNGGLWIGTADKQLVLWRPDEEPRRVVLPGPETVPQPRQVLEDSDRNIWVASHFGLYRLRQAPFRTEVLDDTLKLRVFDLTATSDGSLWFAAADKVFQLAPGETRPVMVGDSAIYRTLTPSLSGGVFGTAAGNTLLRLAPGQNSGLYKDETIWQAPSAIDSLFESSTTGLWVGTLDGLFHQVEAGFQRVHLEESITGGVVVAIREDGESRLLVLHGSGPLYRRNGRHWERLSPARWNEDNDAVGFTVSPQGTIWVACRASALACFHEGKWRAFGPAVLELPQGAMGIESDLAGGLWWNTYGEGVFHLDPESAAGLAAGTLNRALTIRFGLQDGLLSLAGDGYEDTPVRDAEGRIWVPTAVGASVVDPQLWRQKRRTANPPHIHLDSIALDGADFPARSDPGQPARVPAGVNRIDFRCSLVELSAPDSAFFSYRLVNYDPDWVTVRSGREVTYRKLPPGEYSFEARAANWHLDWSGTRTLATLVVLPFWWQTWWFRSGIVLMLTGGAWVAYATRVRHFLRQQALQQDFSRRLIDAQEIERKRIAGELHDGLGQNLLVIKSGATMALRNLDQPEKLRRRLEELTEISGEAVQEVRDISHALRPMQLDELGLTNAITAMLRKVGKAGALKLESRIESVDGLLPAEFEISLYRVVQECMNNIQKHAHASNVDVEIAVREATNIHLNIADDGQGFDAERMFSVSEFRSGMGLRGIQERVRNMNGTVEVSSCPGAGARVAVVIPCPKQLPK